MFIYISNVTQIVPIPLQSKKKAKNGDPRIKI